MQQNYRITTWGLTFLFTVAPRRQHSSFKCRTPTFLLPKPEYKILATYPENNGSRWKLPSLFIWPFHSTTQNSKSNRVLLGRTGTLRNALPEKLVPLPLRYNIIKTCILMKIRLKAAQEWSVRAMEQSEYPSLLGLHVLVTAPHRPPSFHYLPRISDESTGCTNHQYIQLQWKVHRKPAA